MVSDGDRIVEIFTPNARDIQSDICKELMEARSVFDCNREPSFAECSKSGILACIYWINGEALVLDYVYSLRKLIITLYRFTLVNQPQFTLIHLNRVIRKRIDAAGA